MVANAVIRLRTQRGVIRMWIQVTGSPFDAVPRPTRRLPPAATRLPGMAAGNMVDHRARAWYASKAQPSTADMAAKHHFAVAERIGLTGAQARARPMR